MSMTEKPCKTHIIALFWSIFHVQNNFAFEIGHFIKNKVYTLHNLFPVFSALYPTNKNHINIKTNYTDEQFRINFFQVHIRFREV